MLWIFSSCLPVSSLSQLTMTVRGRSSAFHKITGLACSPELFQAVPSKRYAHAACLVSTCPISYGEGGRGCSWVGRKNIFSYTINLSIILRETLESGPIGTSLFRPTHQNAKNHTIEARRFFIFLLLLLLLFCRSIFFLVNTWPPDFFLPSLSPFPVRSCVEFSRLHNRHIIIVSLGQHRPPSP